MRNTWKEKEGEEEQEDNENEEEEKEEGKEETEELLSVGYSHIHILWIRLVTDCGSPFLFPEFF